MPNINVLPKEIAELIAAGEVVERPASVIKELVENSIDAGAKVITVEIERGGITYMRVTDNGCGIPAGEVKTAFLRHATSKIKNAEDLDAIFTLGFRGEALASISAVSKVEILTKTKDADFGTGYVIHGGEEVSFEEVGCPEGTTIVIRDLFYNVPARMKFLKKDVSEANTVAAIIERIALSHPEVSIKLIRDGKVTVSSSGDGKLKSAVYSVLGRDYTSGIIPVLYDEGALKAEGFVSMPSRCRPNRNGQFFFLNGRYIKSGTMAAALDQAYKNSTMVGKFPAAVLNITVPAGVVDVNVHPTKTEVRFSDERSVFELVYRAAREAIAFGDRRPELKVTNKVPNMFGSSDVYTQVKVDSFKPEIKAKTEEIKKTVSEVKPQIYTTDFAPVNDDALSLESSKIPMVEAPVGSDNNGGDITYYHVIPEKAVAPKKVDIDIAVEMGTPLSNKSVAELKEDKAEPFINKETVKEEALQEPLKEVQYIGEAFSTYIIASVENTVYFIDKHAAHERINFEKLKSGLELNCQLTLMPVSVALIREEYNAVILNLDILKELGFIIEDFGDNTVVVRGVPAILSGCDLSTLISEIAGNLLDKGTAESEKIDDILHSIACKSAIKAGNITSKEEQLSLAEKVLNSKSLMYCPHGRPIAFSLTKSQIEKQFGRLG